MIIKKLSKYQASTYNMFLHLYLSLALFAKDYNNESKLLIAFKTSKSSEL